MDETEQVLAKINFPGAVGSWTQPDSLATKSLADKPQTPHPVKAPVAIDLSYQPVFWISPCGQWVWQSSRTWPIHLDGRPQAQRFVWTKMIVLSTPSV